MAVVYVSLVEGEVASCRALASAFASACVFPGSSLEYPLPMINSSSSMPLSDADGCATMTHPTQNAVGTGVHFRASSRACLRYPKCFSSSAFVAMV